MINKDPIYIPAMGIACSLGIGKEAVAHALFNPTKERDFQETQLLSGKKVPVHRISCELAPLEAQYEQLDSRNNRLLKLVLDEIADHVMTAKAKYGSHRIGIILATSTSGMKEAEEAFIHRKKTGSWPSRYYYQQQETASPSLFAAEYFGITGPAYTISTACSSGSKAFCSAQRLLHSNICDAVMVGGVDTLCNLTLNGFDALELIDETLCKPFSKNRAGITIGEGAAVFLLTKEKSSIEFAGGGESSDAYHISSPSPQGDGAEIALKKALKMANLTAEDIQYINLHGTGTYLNDAIESHCLNRLFGPHTPCSSTKALTGHTLGASGAIEAGFLWLSLNHEHQEAIPLPPHIWDGVEDPDLAPLCLTTKGHKAFKNPKGFSLMSNSFAFGGSNVSIILRKGPHAHV